LTKRGARPVRQAHHVLPDEHLAVAVRAGADPDRRDRQRLRHQRGDRGGDRLEHDGERTGVLERERIVDEAARRAGAPGLRLEAAELRDALRREADVRHHGDATKRIFHPGWFQRRDKREVLTKKIN